MMPDDVSVRTASLTPETIRLTPEEEQSTPMAAGDPNTTRITPTGERSSRIITKPYFTGKATTGIVLPDLNKFQEEICKGLEVLMRFRRLGNIPPMVVPETHYSHRINLANYDIEGKFDEQIRISVAELLTEKLTEEVKQLPIQKSALAVGVRACVAWEGERVLGVIAENEEMKKAVKLLRSEFDKVGRRDRGTLLFTGPPVNALVKKTLVLDVNGLLVKVSKEASNLHPCKAKGYRIETATDKPISFVVRNMAFQFLLRCVTNFHVILWSNRRAENLDAILKEAVTKKFIPFILKEKCRAIWAQEQCEAYHTHREDHKGGVLYAKPLDKLYELNLSTKSVLMVDDSFEKNSTNHPQQAVHPPTFDPFSATRSSDKYLMNTLLPWLEKFGQVAG
ncbi:hypothetical protein R1sor_018934 [Riccia sorocarpa]|uniref:Mitochondrial import inner membrane translocase subunit TIM50 n=1 Tax=Riccia sorocarpa TaxID=122646 RepID=A0ABD3IDU8_9MARC